jgi:MFS family permease
LGIATFRALITVQLGANVGIWIHTMVAQWLLTSNGGSAMQVAAVQTAMTLPFFVLALPAGMLADLSDRRWMLTISFGLMMAASAVMAVSSWRGDGSSASIMACTVVLGSANTVAVLAWQSFIPELVGRPLVGAAATLDGMSFNGARAAGPALAGVLLSVSGAGWVFAANAGVFGAAAVAAWVCAPRSTRRSERRSMLAAFTDGVRFVHHSPWTRRLLLRLILFSFPASALWALLPVVAHGRLGLGAPAYGLLFGAVGVGSILGSIAVQPLRRRMSVNSFILLGSTVYAVGLLGAATVRLPLLVGVMLLGVGAAWVTVQTTWMAAAQSTLPPWVRARGLAGVLLVHQGCQAIGALFWGALADFTTLSCSLAAAAVVMMAGASTVGRRPLRSGVGIEPIPVSLWRDELTRPLRDSEGPILVNREYVVPPHRQEEFFEALDLLGGSRRRLGARRWMVQLDPAQPERIIESYAVATWGEFVEQESARWTTAEQRNLLGVQSLAEGPPLLRFLVTARKSRWRARPRPRREVGATCNSSQHQ